MEFRMCSSILVPSLANIWKKSHWRLMIPMAPFDSKIACRLVHTANMENCKPVSTPLDPSCCLSKDLCPQSVNEELAMKNILYLAAVASLKYLAIGTRPDLAHAVGELGQFQFKSWSRSLESSATCAEIPQRHCRPWFDLCPSQS